MLPPLLDPPAGTPLQSYPRLVLSAFPVFVVLGRLLSRNRILLGVWLARSFVSPPIAVGGDR
jgi:hypothetical protein